MTKPRMIRSNVRWSRDMDEPEMRCESCARNDRGPSWWPLTKMFWDPKLGFSACRACHNTKRRLARRAAMDPQAKQRAYYARVRAHRLNWVHQYREANRDRINAVRRARYAARKAEQAAASPQMEMFGE